MEKKTRRSTPRRLYYGPEKMRAAFMAGAGRSGTEIATALGGTSSHKVRAMLRKAGLAMPSTADDRPLPLVLRRRELSALETAADRRDVSPEQLATAVLRACIADPVLFDNIIDDAA
ncbi:MULTISPECIES: hypothetical protein [unclassified Chelatococcus]|uniref:hypothetical protein n=1 Tax=unclassified Chelatococcus TaxID=2638111 RepID=UPI001BCF440D|nr:MULTISPECIES: hypothetical protein [unclassified Chelatococcus]MBS7698680.1 hypothetical protein [Chelatococcus sp. YT9]MBX3554738.1 hypothetical protein [Chelatococcus sp.]